MKTRCSTLGFVIPNDQIYTCKTELQGWYEIKMISKGGKNAQVVFYCLDVESIDKLELPDSVLNQ